MTLHDWLKHCRSYAQHCYAYAGMVDDHEVLFGKLYADGETVQEAVYYVGDKYDLTDWDFPPPLAMTREQIEGRKP